MSPFPRYVQVLGEATFWLYILLVFSPFIATCALILRSVL